MACGQCEGIDRLFDAKKARTQLDKLRRKGPDRTTQMLIEDVIAAAQTNGRSPDVLMDIGGGVGAIHHALLDSGVRRAVHVDASSAYIGSAREEAQRRGHGDRVEFVQGDFVDLADGLAGADIVTLDRVICCYHDMPKLVSRSSEKAGSVYGAVYPRERWLARLGAAGSNVFFRVRGSPFRTFVHPPREIDAVLVAQGFRRRSVRRTLVWEVAVYTREHAV